MVAFDPSELRTLSLEEPQDGVLLLKINRPNRANSMTVEMFREIRRTALALRDHKARALILTGAGERAFCAGFDLAGIDDLMRMGVREYLHLQETAAFGLAALRELPFPVIAAVRGPAAGGGLGLALAADIRLATPSAKFNVAFVKVGLSAGELGVSWQLTRLIGSGRAAELAYTGRVVEADEAERIGLVNRVVPEDTLLDEAFTLAHQIAGNSPGGVRMSKRALQRNQEIASYAGALELENRGQALLTRCDDMTEALDAFKAKRAPHFTGR